MEYTLSSLPSCPLCPELVANRTNVVVGEGSNHPKVIFVGEAPGKFEDEQARPFIGKSGQILRKTLKELGFKDEDFYITNVVKCRPPGNRDPTYTEAKNCFPYLKLQLEKLKPKVICSLGAHSTKYLISNGNFENVDTKSISKQRGEFKSINLYGTNHTLFPTYHPAATIYNQKLKGTFISDLKKLKEHIYSDKPGLSKWLA